MDQCGINISEEMKYFYIILHREFLLSESDNDQKIDFALYILLQNSCSIEQFNLKSGTVQVCLHTNDSQSVKDFVCILIFILIIRNIDNYIIYYQYLLLLVYMVIISVYGMWQTKEIKISNSIYGIWQTNEINGRLKEIITSLRIEKLVIFVLKNHSDRVSCP